jgi:hypothetical protein
MSDWQVGLINRKREIASRAFPFFLVTLANSIVRFAVKKIR